MTLALNIKVDEDEARLEHFVNKKKRRAEKITFAGQPGNGKELLSAQRLPHICTSKC